MATRCFSPPDSWWVRRFMSGAEIEQCGDRIETDVALRRGARFAPYSRLAATLKCGNSRASWNT